MLNGPVTLFWRESLFTQALGWMRRNGYTVAELDAQGWECDDDLHRDIAAALGFPAYYGHNLDALNDCMNDVVDYEYGTSRDAAGLALAFAGYDAFARRRPRAAHAVLDIMADHSRGAMLTGHRLLCLVQSNDPQLAFEPVGAKPVLWNSSEWLDARRRPGSTAPRIVDE
jgi:Barstar (barnase inhibitor)